MISHPTTGKRKVSVTRRVVILTRVMTMSTLTRMAAIIVDMANDWNKRLMILKTGLEIADMLKDTITIEDQDPLNHHLIPKAVMMNKRKAPVATMTNQPT